MIKKIKLFLNNGHQRTILAKKNILFSFGLKFIGLFSMFLLVPLSIKYLGATNYGVWITVSGIIAWAGMFDFGLSHGLRNRLSEALATEDYTKGRSLVSTTYFFLFLISFLIFLLLSSIIILLDWRSVLNLPVDFDVDFLKTTLYIIAIFFILQFLLKPITAVLQAVQWPSISQMMGTIGGVFTVFLVWLLLHENFSSSLPMYAFVVGSTPVIILFIGSIYLYSTKYKYLRPSLKNIKLKYMKSIGGLGLSFFIIQLSLLVVYSSDNLIISYLFGPKEVTTYNVVYKYFSVITIFFSVVMTPFWSAITDAYAKNEMDWIRKTIRTLLQILFGGSFIALIMYLISPWMFSQWIGDDFYAPHLLVLLTGIYAVIMGCMTIFAFFSNGIGKVRIQLISNLLAATINIPLSYWLAKVIGLGSSGVILSTIICISFVSTMLIIQYKKIVSNRAYGIWLK